MIRQDRAEQPACDSRVFAIAPHQAGKLPFAFGFVEKVDRIAVLDVAGDLARLVLGDVQWDQAVGADPDTGRFHAIGDGVIPKQQA